MSIYYSKQKGLRPKSGTPYGYPKQGAKARYSAREEIPRPGTGPESAMAYRSHKQLHVYWEPLGRTRRFIHPLPCLTGRSARRC
jgi:hypothetical protein